MKSYKTLVISAAVGAVLGVAVTLFHLHGRLTHIPFCTFDPALVGHGALLRAGIGVFVLFALYWEVAAKSASKAVKAESTTSRAVHVTLTNLAIVMEFLPIR